jgi:hypothetical protein
LLVLSLVLVSCRDSEPRATASEHVENAKDVRSDGEVFAAGANPTMAVVAGDRLVWVDAVDGRRQELRSMALDGAGFDILASGEYIKELTANGDELAWLEHHIEQHTTELAWRHRDGTVERRRLDGAEHLAFARGGLVVNLLNRIVWISRTGDATDTLEAEERAVKGGPYVRGDKIFWLAAPLADGANVNTTEAWEEARKSSRAKLWEAGPKTAALRAGGLVVSPDVAIDDKYAWFLVNGSLLRVSLSTGARETLHTCEGSCTRLVDTGDALYFASAPPNGSWNRFERFDKATGSLTTAVMAPDATAMLLIVARGHLYWSVLARGIMRHALART